MKPLIMKLKKCFTCKQKLELGYFYITKKGKILSWCKNCFAKYRKTLKRKQTIEKSINN